MQDCNGFLVRVWGGWERKEGWKDGRVGDAAVGVVTEICVWEGRDRVG